MRAILARGLRDDSNRLFREWFGRFVTEPKENLQVFPADDRLTSADLQSRLGGGETLLRHSFSRMAFSRGDGGDGLLYASGSAYTVRSEQSEFLALLTRERVLSREGLADWFECSDCIDLLCRLYNDGHYELAS